MSQWICPKVLQPVLNCLSSKCSALEPNQLTNKHLSARNNFYGALFRPIFARTHFQGHRKVWKNNESYRLVVYLGVNGECVLIDAGTKQHCCPFFPLTWKFFFPDLFFPCQIEKTGCKIICGALTTLTVKGLMMMMMTLVIYKWVRRKTKQKKACFVYTVKVTATAMFIQ